jgi:hypothetical protein
MKTNKIRRTMIEEYLRKSEPEGGESFFSDGRHGRVSGDVIVNKGFYLLKTAPPRWIIF